MRLCCWLGYGLALLEGSCVATVPARYALRVRDGSASVSITGTTSTVPSSARSVNPTITPTSGSVSIGSSSTSVTSDTESSQSSSSPTTTNTTSSTTSSVPSAATPHNGTTINHTSHGEALPISPKITPAIGLAGVILLISGLAYGLVGIKYKWLYTFFSMAYLSSLAVTVLIIYVMNPPASDALQGAFLVAAVVTGCIFGGLCLIFHEISQGLGCALGGFCLSMWLLSLADGGLISSKTGKIIFIAAFTGGTSLLALTKWTRKYGLIAPFSGSTAAVLGIDCFTRAGLKEFWIYLWDLNPDIFPLNTNTYPITRGMRVESAAIIFFFILGVIAQLKLFKLIQKKKDAKKHQQRRYEEDRNNDDGEVGRRVQQVVQRDQARWESIYGNTTNSTADGAQSFETVGKDGINVEEKRISTQDIELLQLNLPQESLRPKSRRPTSKFADGSAVASTLTEDHAPGGIRQVDTEGPVVMRLSKAESASSQKKRTSTADPRLSAGLSTPMVSARNSVNSLLQPPPAVVPLPFRVPAGDDAQYEAADNTLDAAGHESASRRNSKHTSRASSALRRMVVGRSMLNTGPSQEDLINSGLEDDDKASSVAATIDALDGDEISLTASLADASEESVRAPSKSCVPPASPSIQHESEVGAGNAKALPSDKGDGRKKMSANANDNVPEHSAPNTPEVEEWKRMSAAVFAPLEQEKGPHRPDQSAGDRKRQTMSAAEQNGETERSDTEPSTRNVTTEHSPGQERKDSHTENPEKTPYGAEDYFSLKPSGGNTSITTAPNTKSRTPSIQDGERTSDSHTQRERRNSLKSGVSTAKPTASRPVTRDSLSALPPPMSKIVMSFRTNEWAKHLAAAETPDPETLPEPSSPGIAVDTSFASEKAQESSPVDPTGIVGGEEPKISYAGAGQVDPSQQPRPLTSGGVQASLNGIPTQSLMPSSKPTRPVTASAIQIKPSRIPRSNSQLSLQQAGSNVASPQLSRQNSAAVTRSSSFQKPHHLRNSRNFSTPLLGQTVAEVFEDGRSGMATTSGPGLAPLPNNTLLDKRGSMLKQRISTVGFNNSGFASTPNFSSNSPTTPIDSPALPTIDADELPLTERKAFLEGRKPSVRSAQAHPWNGSTAQLSTFNSHQPKRSSGATDAVKRESLLNSWRSTLREELGPKPTTPVADEGRRATMLHERRREQMAAQQSAQAQQQRDQTFDTIMRSDDAMVRKHREAMRKMQAGAKT